MIGDSFWNDSRANRCIFVINELPDLQARIQVALFNILQEGDIQIRGFKLRMPLDMQFVFMLILKIIQTVVVL
jgi:Mg-chelatase subunit ChlI